MSAIVIKPIKPERLRVEAIKQVIEAEANLIANDMLLDFELTTWTWKHQPKFQKIVQVGPDDIEILVGTDDQIYQYLDDGTRKNYPIPKNPATSKTLRFQGTYTAKTVPGVISAKSGGASGPFTYRKQVIHPGIKARKFSKTIAKTWDKKMVKRVDKALQRAIKASGHAI